MRQPLPLGISLAFLMTVFPGYAIAAENGETPAALEGGRIISVEEAKQFIEQGSVTVVDLRNSLNYGRGHIPGAISVPYAGIVVRSTDFQPDPDSFDMSKLPADRTAAIMFYSHGITGWKSYYAATMAIRAGYKNVLWLRGGYSEWEEAR